MDGRRRREVWEAMGGYITLNRTESYCTRRSNISDKEDKKPPGSRHPTDLPSPEFPGIGQPRESSLPFFVLSVRVDVF